MAQFTILYDEPHEGQWFKSLHTDLANAKLESITSASKRPEVAQVLAYDRPDIILLDSGKPILVIEETVEVPSGHNVGQRFARIAAAAEAGVPCVYFGPYVAKKHGGITAGPRYMNLRLFYALDAMIRITGSAITTINWPVDKHCEVRRDTGKDAHVKEYLNNFFNFYYSNPDTINDLILNSQTHKDRITERDLFAKNKIKRKADYDTPPTSLEILPVNDFLKEFKLAKFAHPSNISEVALYNVGMKKIRSDPYAGMRILYKYLYISENPNRILILWFPNITIADWKKAAVNQTRKDIRLFRIAADAILFSDGLLVKSLL